MLKNLSPLILRYNAMQCSPMTLTRLSELWQSVDGSMHAVMDAAVYVNTELCIRCAHQLYRVGCMPRTSSVKALWNMYSETLSMLDLFQKQLAEKKYPQVLRNDYAMWMKSFDERHGTTIATVAEAVHEARMQALRSSLEGNDIFQLQLSQIETVTASMLRTHLSISLLMRQMMNIIQRRPNLVAPVNLLDCVEQQVIAVENLAEHAGLPNARFEICSAGDLTTIGVEPIIEHPIHEILKNAVYATIKHHQSQNIASEPAPIKITIHESQDFVYVGVEDEGMGMRPDQVHNCFRMLWSSATKRYDRINEQQTYQHVGDPLRGLGMGLTMSRLYTQHHGGDTQLVSIQGKGTHVVLSFSKNVDLPERIPLSSHGEFSLFAT